MSPSKSPNFQTHFNKPSITASSRAFLNDGIHISMIPSAFTATEVWCLSKASEDSTMRAGQRVQKLSALAPALPEDQSSVPSTHVKWLTSFCQGSSRYPMTSAGPLGTWTYSIHLQRQTLKWNIFFGKKNVNATFQSSHLNSRLIL